MVPTLYEGLFYRAIYKSVVAKGPALIRLNLFIEIENGRKQGNGYKKSPPLSWEEVKEVNNRESTM